MKEIGKLKMHEKFLLGNLRERRLLRRCRYKWEGNINESLVKICLKFWAVFNWLSVRSGIYECSDESFGFFGRVFLYFS